MKNYILSALLLISPLTVSYGKVSFGKCPKVKYMEDFNPKAYVGKWYEIVRDRLNPMTISTDCVTKEFGLNTDGDVDLYFRGYYSLLFRYNGAGGTLY